MTDKRETDDPMLAEPSEDAPEAAADPAVAPPEEEVAARLGDVA